MLFIVTILSCVGVQVFCFPPYANDVYLRMALDRAKDSAYPSQWYNNPYAEDAFNNDDYLSPQLPDSQQFQDASETSLDMEVDAYWPQADVTLGQVAGVAVDGNDDPVVFHRADHPWNPQYALFDEKNNFLARQAGPITIPTVLTMSSEDGSFINAWGANKFYMPHGISIDDKENVWLTDVAMHQVFKFTPGSDDPDLVLGKAFEPATSNDDEERFCKPTDVAVSSDGTIFVADGYCNSRVMRFSADGEFEGQIGDDDFVVPHSLALAEDLDLICVADRENRRILCYNAGLQDKSMFGRLERAYSDPMNSKVYAVEYNEETGLLFAVNAASYDSEGIGYTMDLHEDTHTADIIDVWSPFNNGFTAPHDIAVTHDGSTVYVGEITLQDLNIWRFNDVASETESDDLDLDVPADSEQQSDIEETSDEFDGSNEEQIDNDGSEIDEENDGEVQDIDEELEEISEQDKSDEESDGEAESDEESDENDKEKISDDKEKEMERKLETYERIIDSGAQTAM